MTKNAEQGDAATSSLTLSRKIMSANRLSHILETAKVDWTKLTVAPDTGTRIYHRFPLNPEDFLRYSEADLQAGGMRGYINAISNAKRAMDCRVESIIYALGYSPSLLRSQLGKAIVARIEAENRESELPLSYRFIQSLGGFTPAIVDRVRVIRHDIEHRYQKPGKRKAREALDIATLFVRSIETITSDIYDAFSFGSIVSGKEGKEAIENILNFNLNFDSAEKHIEMRYWVRPRPEGYEVPVVKISAQHPTYYWLVKCAIFLSRDLDVQDSIREFVSASMAKIPRRSIKVIAYE